MARLRIAAALGLLGMVAAAGPVFAQGDDSGADNLESPAALRCSALAEIDPAGLPTAIAYIAGYGNGERDAITFANVGTSTEGTTEGAPGSETANNTAAGATSPAATTTTTTTTATTTTSETPQVPRPGGPSAAILPAIPVEAIAAACAQSPDSRVLDIVTAQGVMNAQ